jgi:hypothetical protein
MSKLDQDALGVKGVAALQNEAPLVELNVVAANGAASEFQRSRSILDRGNAATNIFLYFLHVFFIF